MRFPSSLSCVCTWPSYFSEGSAEISPTVYQLFSCLETPTRSAALPIAVVLVVRQTKTENFNAGIWGCAHFSMNFTNFIRSACNEYKTMHWCDTIPLFSTLRSGLGDYTCIGGGGGGDGHMPTIHSWNNIQPCSPHEGL